MDADEEDFVVFGVPIEREEDTSARKRKAAADAGQLRALPAWKQEVRDEEGRRRFHGAFTGGFSAGFYNTVGSKEGWAPQSFTSSRKNRAEVKQQSIYSFLDDDEKEELGANSLKTSSVFDTFGFTAAELSRKQAEEDQKKRPSVIPGPVPDELVLPTANSIGIKLLLKMGWRHGHSIKDAHNSLYDARREARKAFLALSGNEEKIGSTEIDGPDDGELTRKKLDSIHASQGSPEFLLQQKQDLHGLGYDPFKHAPEFRDRKGSHVAEGSGNRIATLRRQNLFSSNSGKIAPGFGIGALEELDIEDEDIYDSGFQVEETSLGDIEQPSRTIKDIKMLPYHKNKVQGGLAGFKPALDCGYKVERFRPPNIPHDFDPYHKFSAPLEVTAKFFDCNPPPEVSPPSDSNLRVLIEGLATLVCRCGKLFEDLSREKNRDNPMFSFLNGGHGHAYYSRMLWEQQQKHADHKMLVVETKSSVRKMTAESRGRVLGEKPLEKTSIKSVDAPVQTVHFQSNLFDTFTKPSSHSNAELMKPFKEDPAKQERFEQFLKDKFEGGLRSTYSGTSNALSETDRARERLDFEAALEGLQKNEPKYDQASILKFMEGQTDRNTQFTSGVEMGSHSQKEAKSLEKMYPKREEFHWRPAPVLCKRFDIIDPFMGKPPPLPRARSRMDSLVFTSDFTKTVKTEEAPIMQKPSSSREGSMIEKQIDNITEVNEEPVDKGVQKPVDLYKAIFSDDSDVDDDAGRENPVNTPFDDPKKKTEGVNKALNRLVAGDFLESLGKELGLVVPIDEDYTATKISSAQHMEGPRANAVDMAASRETSVYTQRNISGEHKDEVGDLHPSLEVVYHGDQQNEAMTIGYSGESDKMSVELHNLKRETRLESYTSHPKHLEGSKSDKRDIPADRFQDEKGAGTREKTEVPSKTMKTISRHYSSNSSSDSDSARDDGRKKRRLHSKRNRGSESSSDGYDIRLGYKSKRNSSKERSRKHSKHRREKDGNSTRIHSRHRDAKDFSEDEREWRKSRSHNKDSASSRSDSNRKHRRH